MAEPTDAATPAPEVANPPVAETPATPVAETPTPAPAPAPVVPTPIVHDPYLVRQAIDLRLSHEDIGAMSASELQRAVYLLNKQQVDLATRFAQPKSVETPKPVEEPEYSLSAERRAKLAEFDPELVNAIEDAGRAGIARAKKAEAELAAVRQQVSGQAFAMQVRTALEKIPVQQREVVWSKLVQLEQSGELPPNTPPEVAVPLAHKALLAAFGVGVTASTPTPLSPPPAPTPTAKPTNRLSVPAGKSLRDEMIELYREKNDEWEDEDAASAAKNGKFMP